MSEFKGNPGPWKHDGMRFGNLLDADGGHVRLYGSGVGIAMTHCPIAEANYVAFKAMPEMIAALQTAPDPDAFDDDYDGLLAFKVDYDRWREHMADPALSRALTPEEK